MSKIPNWVKPQDRFIVFNDNDSNLHKFRIENPAYINKEDWEYVAGCNLPVEKQKWENVKPVIPTSVETLQSRVMHKLGLKKVDYTKIYNHIKSNPNDYKEEITFIIRENKRISEGFFFFNNGKITYITGAHYMFLSYWQIDDEVEYRDIDRKWFVLVDYVDTTTETVSTRNKAGGKPGEKEIILSPDGFPVMRKTNHRTLLGMNMVKGRRQGASTRSVFWSYYIMMREINAQSGMQSKDEQTAKNLFLKHLIGPWKKLPWFLKPNYSNNDSPKSELVFEQRGTAPGSSRDKYLQLNSTMDFSTSSDPSYYDSRRLRVYINDECGKLGDSLETGLMKRVAVISQCCVLGSDMVGTVLNLSTVESFDKGGRQFFELTKDSHFEKRDESGRTKSGFINVMIPAYEGLKGFIDEYGYSVTDKPTPEQERFIGKKFGSKDYLLNKRNKFKNSDDPTDKIKLSEEKRLYPMEWADCFRQTLTESPFNTELLEEIHVGMKMSEVKRPLGSRGDFVWNIEKKVVDWVPNPDTGKFFMSSSPPTYMQNRYRYIDDIMHPVQDRNYLAGFDPYRVTKHSTRRVSEAGFCIFWDYDPDQEGTGHEKNPDANNYNVTYLNRPATLEECFLDVIYACIFFSCKVYYERNTDKFSDWCENNGWTGYLEYAGEEIAGYYANDKNKQTYLSDLRTWLENYGKNCKQPLLIEQMQLCVGVENMTDLDLLASAGGVQLYRRVLRKLYHKHGPRNDDNVELNDFFDLYPQY